MEGKARYRLAACRFLAVVFNIADRAVPRLFPKHFGLAQALASESATATKSRDFNGLQLWSFHLASAWSLIT